MSALKTASPGIMFSGVGGHLMAGEGLESLFPMEELSVMGLAEVLPRLPNLLRRMRETARAIERSGPDVIVTIDSPDFSLRVARKVRSLGIPIVHYVAPTVWAWRPGRARRLARIVDHVMTLFPFEPPYFEAAGLPATFVGHPVVDQDVIIRRGSVILRGELGLSEAGRVVAVLPGSRLSEIRRLVGVFGETVSRLATTFGSDSLEVVLPTLPHLEPVLATETARWPVSVRIITDRMRFFHVLGAADVALCASGTIVLELARAGLPGVVAYRVNPFTAWIARQMLRIRYVSLVNIIADAPVMPERLQQDCVADRLAADVSALLLSQKQADAQRVAYESVLEALGAGRVSPSARAATVVLEQMAKSLAQGSTMR